MDFTVKKYKALLEAMVEAGYGFQTFTEFLEKPKDRVILLRHDVDARKLHSLRFAEIQHAAGVKGSYYFRMVPQSYDESVIRKIADLGHEIGYHYEDMDFASKKLRPDGNGQRAISDTAIEDVAIEIFKENLEKLRELYPVKTICMHGSPRSPYDNKAVWKKYNYQDFDIIGEPYFDVDFSKVFYLTDTGRRWDGGKVSVRDKVASNQIQDELSFHSTDEIIEALKTNSLPDQIMFTFHPQRWTDKVTEWVWELFFQNLKNQVKAVLIKRNKQ